MEILKDKGQPIVIFGKEYKLTISLKTLQLMAEKLGPLEELRLNIETVPEILALMIQDYFRKHPDEESDPDATDPETLRDYLTPEDVQELTKFIFSMLNPSSSDGKNA